MKEFLKKQLGYLLFGIIVWLPVAIISIIGNWAFRNLDGMGQNVIDIFPFGRSVPAGAGFPTILFLLWLSGILLKKTKVRSVVAKIPVLGSLMGVNGNGKTISIERLLSLQPCLFLFSPTCSSYGFILSEEKVTLDNNEAPFTLLNIYLPNAPAIIMGQVFPVRKETVIKLGNSSTEIISLLLYASRSPKSMRYLPWPEETKEEFEERTKRFGLG